MAETQKPFSEDDEEEEGSIFARKFTSLLTTLCSNYELLLIQPSPDALKLFELMKDCAKAANQRVAVQSLNFWLEMHETVTTVEIENLKSYQHLFEEYTQISQVMLMQSVKIASIDY